MKYLVSIVSTLIGFAFFVVAYYLFKAKDGNLRKALIGLFSSLGIISISEAILYYCHACINIILYIPAICHVVLSAPVLISIIFLVYYAITEKSIIKSTN